MAQLRWQKPADGSQAVAITQILWHQAGPNVAICVLAGLAYDSASLKQSNLMQGDY